MTDQAKNSEVFNLVVRRIVVNMVNLNGSAAFFTFAAGVRRSDHNPGSDFTWNLDSCLRQVVVPLLKAMYSGAQSRVVSDAHSVRISVFVDGFSVPLLLRPPIADEARRNLMSWKPPARMAGDGRQCCQKTIMVKEAGRLDFVQNPEETAALNALLLGQFP